MKYKASITDFFKCPKWGNNLLLGAVTMLIPLVGPMVLSGWHITLFWARGDDDAPANYPAFDFQYFGKYLERGLWPFLVSLVASFVLVPVAMALFFGPVLLSGIASAGMGHHDHDGIPIALMLSMFGIYPIFLIAFQLVLIPLVLRATITQDFAPAFDFGFMKRFLTLVWKELLVSLLFLFGTGICLTIATVLTCYIGGLLLGPVAVFAWHHLQKQLYQHYLSRGGEPVPTSPKLQDVPPPLPAA